ncbi:MAG: sensor histidine kinase [Armatimonadota bacterium]
MTDGRKRINNRNASQKKAGDGTPWQRALEAMAEGILLLNPVEEILFANASAGRILGVPHGDLPGRTYADLQWRPLPVDGQTVRPEEAPIIRVLRTGKALSGLTRRNSSPDGRHLVLSVNISPIFAEGGTVENLVISFTDITRQHKTLKALHESEARYRLIVEGSDQVFFYIHDIEHRFVYLSPSVRTVLGYTPEELVGHRYEELLTGDVTDARVEEYTDAALRTGRRLPPYSVRVRRKDGNIVVLGLVESPRRQDGAVTGLQGFARDITLQVVAMREAEFERARLLSALETFPQPVVILDTDETVLIANPAAEAIWQLPLVGTRWAEVEDVDRLLRPETGAEVPANERPVRRALQGEEVRDFEVILEHPDGSRVPLLLHASPIHLDDDIVGAIEAGLDLTKLKEADRIKDYFLAMVSHDLRSPLVAILGWAQLAAESDEPPLMKKALEVVMRNVTVQQELINDLLDASALASGRLRVERKNQDLRPIVQEVVAGAQGVAQERGITLTLERDETSIDACVDAKRLRQILGNLLGNALKFTPRDGRVTVSLRRQDPDVVLSVRDTGRGISADILPHIFERFYRPQISPFTRGKGLGLGLSIVKALTDLHQGRITAESPGEGKGSTFTVYLPLVCEEMKAKAA